MKFTYKKPKTIPVLELDENKIQQVVMNFADNAIYYSKENSTIAGIQTEPQSATKMLLTAHWFG